MNGRAKFGAGLAVGVALLAFDAFAAETLVISQKKRMFNPGEITIHKGDTLHVVNDDQFTHQIYVDNPDFHFDSNESDPGNFIDVKFTATGRFDVLCHIHPKMRLQVTVQ